MTYLGYKTSNFYNKIWVRIFHHNSLKGYFVDKREALFSFNSNHKFSVLGALNSNNKIGGYFEFVLDYQNDSFQLHWRQTQNPIEGTFNNGYEPLHVDPKFSRFSGLGISYDPTLSLLDGTPGSNYYDWWYSVGTYSNEFKPGIPVYQNGNSTYTSTWVDFWLCISSLDVIKDLPDLQRIKCSCKTRDPCNLPTFLLMNLLCTC
jgi:hypothetical protein